MLKPQTLRMQDAQIALLMQQPGWQCYPARSYVLFEAPDKQSAYNFIQRYSEALAAYWCPVYLTVDRLSAIAANYKTGRSIMSELYLEFGQSAKLTLPLLRIADEMLSHPEQSTGLVRVADNAQIVVTGGAEGAFMMGASPEHYNQLRREQYWDAESLHGFEQEWRSRLTIGGDWETFEYLIRYPSPGKVLGSRMPPDSKMITDFRLVEDGNGNLYHYCRNRDLIAI